MDAKYAKDELKLKWGEVEKEDIIRRMYKRKPLNEMSPEEIDRMLDDLI